MNKLIEIIKQYAPSEINGINDKIEELNKEDNNDLIIDSLEKDKKILINIIKLLEGGE